MIAPCEGLTPREFEVLVLLEEGASTREIARRLEIAPSTTKDRLNSIYANAGVANRRELVTSFSDREVDLTGLGLTPRQQQVACLLLAGGTNHAIAEKLCISPETVRRHLRGIYRQFGVSNRYEAIALRRTASA